MPIQYPGVLEEHRACRERAVVFDVSHLGSVRVARRRARSPLLQWALTNDLDRIGPGRAQYTHLLDPDDAHVVDDIIVWWVDADEFLVMPNASNTDPIVGTLARRRRGARAAAVRDRRRHRDACGARGAGARGARAARRRSSPELAAVPRFAVAPVAWGDVECIVAGTGYTGEDGVEIHVPGRARAALWRRARRRRASRPAGLGARDTLRLEAGLPLHGHELGPGITPLQAGLGWVVRCDKGDFRGRAPLAAEQERGVAPPAARPARRRPPPAACGLPGARATARRSARSPAATSRRRSSTAIALAFLPPDIADGAAVAVDVRGHERPGDGREAAVRHQVIGARTRVRFSATS